MGQLLTHIVCRTFGDDTIRSDDPLQQRLSEECVNALPWRNLEGLEKSRRVMPMPDGLEPVIDSYGRFWVDLDALNRAGRTVLQAEMPEDKAPPLGVLEFDPDAEDLDFNALVEHGFALPKKVSERRWQLWNGDIALGKAKALSEHSAGVRARIRELRTEHLAPAAGSATDT